MNDIPVEAQFHLKHGENTSNRIEEDLIKVIQELLSGQQAMFQGKMISFNPFGKSGIDVKGVHGFDHIELTITKTGWGREIAAVERNVPFERVRGAFKESVEKKRK